MKRVSAREFLRISPDKFYHAPGGKVDVFSEMDLSFEYGCGEVHNVNACTALVDSGLTNKAVYVCPIDKHCFNLIGVRGLLSIKGLKNLACFQAGDDADALAFTEEVEARKRLD